MPNQPNTKHLKNIFVSGELVKDSVSSKMELTAQDGKNYKTNFYNLDAIISVGYRVNSIQATQFRIWATQIVREFSIKGFVLDDEALKKPDQSFDYLNKLRWCIWDGCRTGFLAMQPYAIGGKILL